MENIQPKAVKTAGAGYLETCTSGTVEGKTCKSLPIPRSSYPGMSQ